MAIPLSLAGGAISAVGGLLGGLSAKSEARKIRERQLNLYLDAMREGDVVQRTPLEKWTNTTEASSSSGDVDLQKMVADAEAAGFNPLTAMRSGLGAYYARTQSLTSQSTYERTEGHNATAKLEAIMAAMGMSMPVAQSDPWSGLVSGLGSALADYGKQQEQNTFELMKQNAYLNGIQRNNSLSGAAHMLNVPSLVKAGPNQNAGVLKTAFGDYVLPKSASAQKVSDEFGEIAEWVYGAGRAIETIFMPENQRTMLRNARVPESAIGWLTTPVNKAYLSKAWNSFSKAIDSKGDANAPQEGWH